ncbi:MAG: VOC family protein [Polyangiales bacterium]
MTTGMFVWRELSTRDPEAATRFYGEVFGWKVTTVPMGENYTYYLVHNGENQVGGFSPKSPDDKSPDGWVGYVHVADVDAAAAAARAHGARELVPPSDIPNVGRFSLFADPQGAMLTLFKSKTEGQAPKGPPPVGDFCWEQLNTTDVAAAKAFYTAVLPWRAGSFLDSETFNAGEAPVASLRAAPPGVPAHWLSHVVVDDLAGARAGVSQRGQGDDRRDPRAGHRCVRGGERPRGRGDLPLQGPVRGSVSPSSRMRRQSVTRLMPRIFAAR